MNTRARPMVREPRPAGAVAGGRTLDRIAILSPFGVYPARSGGHVAVLEPARALARLGTQVHLFGMGVRRFEAFRHVRSFVREIEPRLVEERHVSLFNWLDYLRRGRSGLPGLDAAAHLARRRSGLLRRRCDEADIVQFECPWLFPLGEARHTRVLVAHNCEAALLERLPDAPASSVRRAADLERRAWCESDLVFCFTDADRDELAARYGARDAAVVPLGVDLDTFRPPSAAARSAARDALGVDDRFVVLFTGGWHVPNRAAARRMREWAARLDDRFLFVVAGSVEARPEAGPRLRVTGPVADLAPWFAAADVCVNPVTDGSGANVKLLEYLATGHPVVTTPFGARGIDARDGVHLFVRDAADFPETLRGLRDDADRCRIGAAGRALVERERSWHAIGEQRRAALERLLGGGDR